jgi:hypothetical protein
MIPSQHVSFMHQIIQSVFLSHQQPPTAVIFLPAARTHATPGLFELNDDIRLRAIMERYPEPISEQQWQEIATSVDSRESVQEIHARWYNVVKPGIPFTIPERRQILTLAIDHPCDWEWVARQVRNGDRRYAMMVRNCATSLQRRLRLLGFEVENSSDVGLMPDAVLARDGPKGTQRAALLAEYRAKKACQAAETSEGAEAARTTAAPSLEIRPSSLFSMESLLMRPRGHE